MTNQSTQAKKECKHCGGDLKIRNPKGNCDHLYYPEYCEVCSQPDMPGEYNWEKEFDKEFPEDVNGNTDMWGTVGANRSEVKSFIKQIIQQEKKELVLRVYKDVLAYDCPVHMASCECHDAIEKQQNEALNNLKSQLEEDLEKK